jgi:hypothetical protein
MLGNIYTECAGKVNEDKAIEALSRLESRAGGLHAKDHQQGRQYVLEKFSSPSKEFLARLLQITEDYL